MELSITLYRPHDKMPEEMADVPLSENLLVIDFSGEIFFSEYCFRHNEFNDLTNEDQTSDPKIVGVKWWGYCHKRMT